MLSRRVAAPLAASLLLALAPPLTTPARADPGDSTWQFIRDFQLAHELTLGRGAKVALVGKGAGIEGPAPEAKVLSFPVSSVATLASGIRHAADQKADVIAVFPWVDFDYQSTIRSAVAYAISKNAVIVAASGEGEADTTPAPQALPGVIGVGTVNEHGRRDARFTAASGRTFVAAPDRWLADIGPDNLPKYFEGSVVAVAEVTAAAALVKAKFPKLTPVQVEHALAVSARNPKGRGRYDTDLGFGIVNPGGALEEAAAIAQAKASSSGQRAVPGTGYLGGKKAGVVRAVSYDPVWIGGFGGLAVAGLVAIMVAVRLFTRASSGDAERA